MKPSSFRPFSLTGPVPGLILAFFLLLPVVAARAVPSLSIGGTSVLAGPSGTQHALFPVILSASSASAVSASYATANGTATAGTDYTATGGTLTIPAGSTTGSVSVPVAGGQTDASGLTFTVTLSNPVNATIATATGTATITHDATPVAVSVTPTPLTSPVGYPELITATYSSVGGVGNITTASLNLGKLSSPATSIYAKYLPATGLFYLANSSGTYIGGFAAGSANTITTTMGTLNLASTTVTQNGNNLVIGWDFTPTTSLIGAQNVYLDVTDSFGLTSGFQNLGAWTIVAQPAASINNVSVVAGPSGTQHAIFTVTLTASPLVQVSFNYATANGTATAGTDYTATTGSLNIPAGNTTGTISVPVAGGQTDASGLTFTLTLSNPVNATLSTASGTATIIHDATPVAVSVTPNPLSSPINVAELLTTTYSSVGGAGNIATASLNVGKLSSPSTSLYAKYVPATGLFSLANSSGTYIGGYAAGSANTIATTLGTLNLAATTVTQNGNNLVIGWDFTPTSSLIGAQNVYLDVADNLGLTSGWQNLSAWTIDTPTSAAIGNTSVLAGPSGTQHAIFTVTMTPAPQVAVTFNYATANGTAAAGTDYTATSGTLNIAAGSTTGAISVPVAGGETDASGLTFTVTLSNPVNATIGTATGTATITHDATPVAVSTTPNPIVSPVNTTELLTATYSSVGGAGNIATASLNLGKLSSPAASLYAKYEPATGLFYLANSSGTYIGGYAAGSANTISTSLGTLNLGSTTVTMNGNNLVIGWAFSPSAGLLGAQSVYLDVSDSFGLSSGWQNLGSWTVYTPVSAAIANTGVLAGPTGTQHAVFTVTLSGATQVGVSFSYETANGTATAGTDYTATSGTLSIPAGSTTGIVSVPVAGGQTDASGLTFTVTLSNPVNVSILTATGTATITHDTAPSAVSVTPTPLTSQALSPELLTTTYSSAAGTSNFATLSLNLGKLSSPGTSLYAKYVASSQLFFLANSSGTYIGGFAAGSANTITTTLGTLNLASTTVTVNGNQLVIGWDFTPASSLAGTQNVYLDATDNFGLTSGWDNLGTWTITPITIYSIGGTLTQNGTGAAGVTLNLSGAATASTTTGSGGSYSFTSLAPGTYTVAPAVQTGIAYTLSSQSVTLPTTGQSGSPNATLNFTGGTAYTISGTVLSYANGGASTPLSGISVVASGTSAYTATDGSGVYTLTLPAGSYTVTASVSGDTFTGSLAPVVLPGTGGSAPNATDNFSIYEITGNVQLGGANTAGVPVNLTGAANTSTTTDANGDFAFTNLAAGSYTVAPGAELGYTDTYTVASVNLTLPTSGVTGISPNGAANFTGTRLPSNDNFANAISLTGTTGQIGGTTAGATLQTSEPNPYGAANTVWYDYTGPAGSDGVVTFAQTNSNLVTAVYVGTALTNLVQYAGGGTGATFNTTPGTTYFLQVQSTSGNAGAFNLSWSWGGQPVNDNFANALAITGASGSVNGTTVASTVESGEPNVTGGSVWYLYTAPTGSTGSVTFDLTGYSTVQNVDVYTGTSLSALTEVAGAQTGTQFATVSGASYYIQIGTVASNNNVQTAFTLNWQWNTAPANDNFANAQAISTASGSVAGTTVGSTVQSGEINASNHSVWYVYTAPTGSAGSVAMTLTNNTVAEAVNAYSGTSLGALTQLAGNQNSIQFGTASGVSYYVQIAAYGDNPGTFTLGWQWNSSPANDYFVNAQAISGTSGSVNGTTVGATYQTNDPDAAGGSNTVWYLYTAPASAGTVTFTATNNFQLQDLQLYTGTSISALTNVGFGTYNNAAIVAPAGSSYYLEVSSTYGNPSAFTLSWQWNSTPANDNFANAQAISGASGSVSGTTVGATVESGEPGTPYVYHTVWYAFTAPASPDSAVTFTESEDDTVGVYSGTSVSALTADAVATGAVDFTTTPGTVYYIRVQSNDPTAFTLSWQADAAPANDNFANAQAISGASGSVTGTLIGSSMEPGEPDTSGGVYFHTVWYLYTAPAGASVNETFINTHQDELRVYTGTSLTTLTPGVTGQGLVSFATTSGGLYYIREDNNYGSTFTLSWNSAPANDNFANAQAISGASGSANGTTVGATLESGDPNGSNQSQTVWYKYTAPGGSAVPVTFSVNNNPANSEIQDVQVYSGTALGSLTALTSEGTSGVFTPSPGATYYVEIDPFGSYSASPFTLTWNSAPANDNFANAQPISGAGGSVNGTTTGATIETGDPNPSAGTATVWYMYTAPTGSGGVAGLTLTNNASPQDISVFTGTSITALTSVTSTLNCANFSYASGATYFIEIGIEYGTQNYGSFTLNWATTNPPANDNFANAQAISGASGSVEGTSVGATLETGDPATNTSCTVWYKYTAAATGTASFSLENSGNVTQIIDVYTGTSLAALTQVVTGTQVTFAATSGTAYYVEIQSSGTSSGGFTLTWGQTPANDNFANAQAISGMSGSVNGTTVGATAETNDPRPFGDFNTVWYQYTAPSSSAGYVNIAVSGQSNFEIWSGTALTALTSLGYGNSITLATTPGEQFYVEVGAGYYVPAPFTLTWQWTQPPANDNFANAQALSGTSGSVTGTTVGATVETNDPDPYGTQSTVWYKYTAPSSSAGSVAFTVANGSSEIMEAYSGTSITALTSLGLNGSTLTVATSPGVNYYVEIGTGSGTGQTTFLLSWQWGLAPANDNFANAQAISGSIGSVVGTTVGATSQAGDPSTSNTVWYQYTAPNSGPGSVVFSLTNNSSGEYVGIYSGTSLATLTPVGDGNYDGGDLVTTPGATYYIEVGGAPTVFTLNWVWYAPPANDNFANAQAISGASGSVPGTTYGASAETGDPQAPGSFFTVWYLWTAPSSGPGSITIPGVGPGQNYTVAIYTGTALASLTKITQNYGSVIFATTAGTKYYIEACAAGNQPTNFNLDWQWNAAPANDNFASAQAISGASGSTAGTDVGGTIETGDPNPAGGYHSVWYAYTAPSSAYSSVGFSLNGTSANQTVTAFTGTSLGNLTSLASGSDGVQFPTSAGAAYYIEVDSTGDTPSAFTLTWLAVPANDNFANAQAISGASGSVSGTTLGATIEANDPNPASGDQSVWYRYTAPSSGAGSVALSISGSSVPQYVSVYTGSALTNLTQVAGAFTSTQFATAASGTYYIEVSTAGNSPSGFSLGWQWTASGGTGAYSGGTTLSGSNPVSSAKTSSEPEGPDSVLAMPRTKNPSGHSA